MLASARLAIARPAPHASSSYSSSPSASASSSPATACLAGASLRGSPLGGSPLLQNPRPLPLPRLAARRGAPVPALRAAAQAATVVRRRLPPSLRLHPPLLHLRIVGRIPFFLSWIGAPPPRHHGPSFTPPPSCLVPRPGSLALALPRGPRLGPAPSRGGVQAHHRGRGAAAHQGLRGTLGRGRAAPLRGAAAFLRMSTHPARPAALVSWAQLQLQLGPGLASATSPPPHTHALADAPRFSPGLFTQKRWMPSWGRWRCPTSASSSPTRTPSGRGAARTCS